MRRTSCRRTLRAALLAGLVLLTPPAAADRAEVELVPSHTRTSGVFGRAAGLDGDTAVVTGYDDTQPVVFVFVRGGGDWLEQQKLSGEDPAGTFGYRVAVQDDTLVATAITEEIDGQRTGAAYVFTRSNGVWSQQAKLEPSDPHVGSRFGNSVDLDGDTLVVGDNHHDVDHDRQGAAFVYTRSGDLWTEQQRLTASDAAAADFFGSAVAIDSDTIVVGANANDDRGNGSGTAYVFQRTAGVWQQHMKFLDANGRIEDGFGFVVAMDTDWVAVASPYDDDNGLGSGTVFMWSRVAQSLSREQALVAPVARADAHFGSSLALVGERLLVGADGYDGEGINTGRAYLYAFDGVEWLLEETIDSPAPQEWALFGDAVGLTDDVLLVTASNVNATYVNQGRAWVLDDTPVVQTSSSALIPSVVTATLPAPTKKAKTPGLRAKGVLDTGPDPVDLTSGGTLHVGTTEFDVPEMTRAANGRTHTYDDGVVDFTVKTPRGGGSRATFALRIDADLTGHVDPEGPLTLAYGAGAIDAEVTVVLDGGKFKLGNAPDTLGTEILHCVRTKAKLKGERRDTFKLQLRFGGDGASPGSAPEVTIGFGEAFETVLDQAGFKSKKSKWTFSDRKAEGVTRAVLDFGKGKATITARRATLGAFDQGPAPLTMLLGIGDQLRAVEVRAVVKGKSLKY